MAIIDQGVDGGHPEFSGRIAATIDLDDDARHRPADDRPERPRHARRVDGLRAAGNGIGIAGAGYGCSLLVIKSDLTDSSIASAIVAGHRPRRRRHQHVLRPGRRRQRAGRRSPRDRLRLRARRRAGRRRRRRAGHRAGRPGQRPAAHGHRPDLASGRGLSVTAADFDDAGAPFAGRGSQISMAAYGAFRYRALPERPARDLRRVPGRPHRARDRRLRPPCNCRTTFGGDNRYAYLQGTSMAAPMVAATAALMRAAQPRPAAPKDIICAAQADRAAAGGRRLDRPSWAGASSTPAPRSRPAARRRPHARRSRGSPRPRRVRGRRAFTLRWSGRDPGAAGCRRRASPATRSGAAATAARPSAST